MVEDVWDRFVVRKNSRKQFNFWDIGLWIYRHFLRVSTIHAQSFNYTEWLKVGQFGISLVWVFPQSVCVKNVNTTNLTASLYMWLWCQRIFKGVVFNWVIMSAILTFLTPPFSIRKNRCHKLYSINCEDKHHTMLVTGKEIASSLA